MKAQCAEVIPLVPWPPKLTQIFAFISTYSCQPTLKLWVWHPFPTFGFTVLQIYSKVYKSDRELRKTDPKFIQAMQIKTWLLVLQSKTWLEHMARVEMDIICKYGIVIVKAAGIKDFTSVWLTKMYWSDSNIFYIVLEGIKYFTSI